MTARAKTRKTPRGWEPQPPTDVEKRRARRVHRALARLYPDAACTLDFSNALELYVATVLSAQCTDARVNKVTPDLFKSFPSAADYAQAPRARLEAMVQSTGFFRNKAKMIQDACRVLVERHGGEVPDTMEQLLELPGVGRKTANVLLGNAFDTPGLTVDTHMRRLSQRLGFTAESDPVRIERDLMPRIPKSGWTAFSHRMIQHGRMVCLARAPRCEACLLQKDCPYPARTARATARKPLSKAREKGRRHPR